MYDNDKYYLHLYCCNIVRNRITLNFKPETYTEGLNGTETEKGAPDWVENNGNYYVSGAFDPATETYTYRKQERTPDGSYKFVDNQPAYAGNNLEYNVETKKYKINNVEFDRGIIEYSNESYEYIIEETPPLPQWKLGYEYFETAYYTAENKEKWAKSKFSEEVEKPQDFYYYGDVEGDKPAGTVNVDYVIEDDAYYTLKNYKGVGTVTKEFVLYPNRFVNPYDTGIYDDDATTIENLTYNYSSGNPYLFVEKHSVVKDEATAESVGSVITHKPTYYFYEGGYYVEGTEDAEYRNIVSEGGLMPIYVPLTEYEKEVPITIKNGNVQKTVYFKEINITDEEEATTIVMTTSDNFNDYKEWIVVNSQGDSMGALQEIYQWHDSYGVCKYNSNYTLGEDYLLNRISISIPEENRKYITMFENLYLSADVADYGLYTYYKYSSLPLTWDNKYRIVPEKANTTVVNRAPTIFVENCRVMMSFSSEQGGFNNLSDFSGGSINIV